MPRAGRSSTASGPAIRLNVDCLSPFAATGDAECPCLFRGSVATLNDVYLWTVPVNGEFNIWYVGQTRRDFRDTYSGARGRTAVRRVWAGRRGCSAAWGTHTDPAISGFIWRGQRVPGAIPNEAPLHLTFSCSARISGPPDRLLV